MASKYQRSRTRTRANTRDQTAFILIILLAAALYAHHKEKHLTSETFLEAASAAIILCGLIICIMQLRKRYELHKAHYLIPSRRVDKMSGIEFEKYVAFLLPSQGFHQVHLTEHYDLGVDIIAEKSGVLWGIQIKRSSSPVKMNAIRQAVTALNHYSCDRAMVITNSTFTRRARGLALSNNCILIDGHQLARWTSSQS